MGRNSLAKPRDSDRAKHRTLAYSESTTFPTCSSVSIAAPYVLCGRRVRTSSRAMGVRGTHVCCGLFEDEEAPSALVKHPMEDLVQDHLRQPTKWKIQVSNGTGNMEDISGYILELHRLPPLANLLCDVFDLHNRVGLDDSQQVLLEQGVIQCG